MLFIGTLGTFTSASAGQAEILLAQLIEDAPGWRGKVTLRHADAGWDHYTKAWRIIADTWHACMPSSGLVNDHIVHCFRRRE